MKIDRRNFLVHSGLAVAAGAASTFSLDQKTVLAAPSILADDPQDWQAVRAQFDRLSQDHIHMSSFFLASHPRPVRLAIEKYRNAIDNNPFVFIEENMFTMPARVQQAAAEYVGGRADEIAITNSTTMGLAFVYQGLPVASGQVMLTTTHDHFVHHEAIRLAAERSGAVVKKIDLYDDIAAVSEDDMVRRIIRAITPKTRTVGITWVHSSTGLKLPVRNIAAAISGINKLRSAADRVVLVVDGVHGFGVEDETVSELGADFFVAGTHKWIFGPRGTGIIWAKAANWNNVRMTFPGFAMETFGAWMAGAQPKAPTQASWVTQGGFHAFEYEWALPAAFDFHKQIGRSRIARRIHELNDHMKEGLAKMSRVKLYTPRGSKLSSGLICFDVEGMRSGEVVKRLLEKRIVASTAPYKNPYARLAPSLLNTPEEIEATLRAIKALT